MATNFPTSLDTLTNPTSSDSLSSPSHASQHANVNDAVEALQAKVGVNGSAVTSSLDYKLANIGTWTTFTPALRFDANTITPGASFGRYTVINDLVIVSVYAINSTFTGSGTLYFDLPSGASIDMPQNFPRIGYGQLYDTSTGIAYITTALMQASSTTQVRFNLDGISGSVTNTSPFTFTSGSDEIHFTLIGIKA